MSDINTVQNIIDIAEQAGQIILQYYQGNFDVGLKDDQTPVTIADQKASQFIINQLQAISPHPVISEEAPVPSFSVRQSWQNYWLIDPLDGTKEFIHHRPEFTVNIALISQGRPIFGVVYAPALAEFFFGWSAEFNPDGPASFSRIDGQESALAVERDSSEQLHILSGRTRPKPRLDKLIRQLPAVKLSELGSSLKICRVAQGQADLYPRFGPTSEWDTAAAQIILLAAGGVLTDLNGQTLSYNSKDSLLNPDFLAAAKVNQTILNRMRLLSHRISI